MISPYSLHGYDKIYVISKSPSHIRLIYSYLTLVFEKNFLVFFDPFQNSTRFCKNLLVFINSSIEIN